MNPNLATDRGPHMLLFYTAGTHAFRVPLPGSAEVLEVDVTCKSTEIQATSHELLTHGDLIVIQL